jgi:DNA polymerase bacteriophage-type
MPISHAANAGSHTLAERANDLYETPPVATEAVMRVEQLPQAIWEPASGRNAITNVLRAHGHRVVASDLVDYGGLDFVGDFLKQEKAPAGVECILTNPPFKLANEFVAHALDLCSCVIVLARLAFLESERRSEILERRGLARIHVFRDRLPMMHRDGWTGPRASSAVAYAWFCWDRGHLGPTNIDRISWRPSTSDHPNSTASAPSLPEQPSNAPKTPAEIENVLDRGAVVSLDIARPSQVVARDTNPRDLAARHILHQDFETRSSRVDLRKVGAHRYAADPATEVICCAYAVDDEPVQLWTLGDPVPAEFIEAARNSNWVVVAHNDMFETAIERHIMVPRHGWPKIPSERRECSQSMCLAVGLPAKLSAAAVALELGNLKDVAGEGLMHQMTKPRRPHKDEDPAGTYWFDDAERLDRLYGYCRQDVETERELHGRLPPLSPAEHSLRGLSNRINERGFHIDRGFAEAARKVAKAAAPEIDAELAEITGGAVTGINQVARLQAWLQQRGYAGKSLDRKAIERQLENEDLAAPVRRVLELRLGGAQAAVKKIDALLARAGVDNRIRGAFRFHGASTGRWAGEGFQPQNLKKPVTEDLDAAVAAVATGDYAHVKKLYPRPLSVVGDCSRSMICAAAGHVLIGADFSAIESRVLAWVAGEEWKLDSYRRYDATRDPRDEPYCITACKIHRVPDGTYTKESPERGVGKTCDLAFGYMGGLNAWRKFEPGRFSDEEVEKFKQEWRAAHPKIKRFWYDIDIAAWNAVRERGRVFRCGPVAFRSNGAFLQLKLPNGRKLSYPRPRIIGDEREQRVVFADNSAGQFKDCRHGQGAYGGTWTENIVQAISRDLLAEAMLRIETAGYPIVLHVHDEVACEVPIGFGSTEEFTRLMVRRPAWALELPIAAEAWSGPRYVKK